MSQFVGQQLTTNRRPDGNEIAPNSAGLTSPGSAVHSVYKININPTSGLTNIRLDPRLLSAVESEVVRCLGVGCRIDNLKGTECHPHALLIPDAGRCDT